MNKRRVVITGLGAITPVGLNVKEFWNAVINGKSGIGPLTYFDTTEYTTKIAGEIKNFKPQDHFSPKDLRKMDNFVQYALVASREAVKDAELDLSRIDPHRVGVIVGVGIGGIKVIEEQLHILDTKGPGKVSPFLIPKIIPNMASGIISIEFGFKGPNSCIVTACASGTNSIGDSFKIIQRGDADIMISGGSESTITRLGVAGFCNMGALSRRNNEPEKASRPFDKDRDGFVVAEGAGIVILEALEHAIKRNAKIYAEIIGYGMTGDAYHITAPDETAEGGMNAMKLALNDAGLAPDELEYINAHGTSTPLNDKCETLAIKKVFGDYAYKIPVNSTKSMIGHLLGGAGGIEFIVLVLTIKEGIIHPTINYETPDPDCDLDYVPNIARKQEVRTGLSNSLGFGGHNAIVVAKKFEQ